VASLAVGAVRARPVAVEREPGEYVVAVHPVGTLGLSFDHRAIDSGYAADFLDAVRIVLETRDWSAEY
jgi:pyruvate dehydrogenase E2 component (dihydrolipoamide acetyltransferase)